MTRLALITILLTLPSMAAFGQDNAGIPPIKGVTDAKPASSIFAAASRQKPLVIKSNKAAAKHFSDDALAKLQEQVDFDKQIVLVFAWRGSGQDKLSFDVLESFPEQVVFKYTPGRTKDLRPHIYTFVLRSNVTWRPGSKTPAAPKRQPNRAMAKITDDPKLPRVLLIGDSISIAYTVPTRQLLEGKANVHRPLTNCGPTTKGILEIDKWLGDGKWDVIHFNWGLHDLKYMGPKGGNLADPNDPTSKPQVPIDEYERHLDTLVQRLKKTGAKLIWRNTTPVPPGCKGRVVGDSANYNAAAARVMKKHSVATHDLFTLSKKRMEEIMRPANVHFHPAGSAVLAQEVANVIEEALKSAGDEPKEVFKAPNGKAFPSHWGAPPRLQTRDLRPLPGGFGRGSGTLAKWIQGNLERDENGNRN